MLRVVGRVGHAGLYSDGTGPVVFGLDVPMPHAWSLLSSGHVPVDDPTRIFFRVPRYFPHASFHFYLIINLALVCCRMWILQVGHVAILGRLPLRLLLGDQHGQYRWEISPIQTQQRATPCAELDSAAVTRKPTPSPTRLYQRSDEVA